MNALPNNLAQYWFSADASSPAVAAYTRPDHDVATPTQQQELDALADRVNAARSVF